MLGKFIVFEGLDGCGKSTQMELTRQWLDYKGYNLLTTREPGGTELGEEIRRLLKQKKFDSITELLLLNASRRDNITQLILPHLQKGGIVLCDRFYYSSIAYQGYGYGLDIGDILYINTLISKSIEPDLVILIDIEPITALERISKRDNDEPLQTDCLSLFNRIRKGYLHIESLGLSNISKIDGLKNVEEIQRDIRELTTSILLEKHDGN